MTKQAAILKHPFLTQGSAFAWMAAITAFLIPILKGGIQLPIILLFITWIFSPKGRGPKNAMAIIVFIGVYLFHILAMSYTSDRAEGLEELVQKLSILLFPILFGTAKPLKYKQHDRVLSFFCYGVLVAVLISYATSIFDYMTVTHSVQSFYMTDFSPVHHASYLAMYITLALAIFGVRLFDSAYRKQSYWYMLAMVFLALSLIFPASKMGFIVFSALVFYLLFLAWRTQQLRSSKSLFVVVLFIGFIVFLKFDPVASKRVSQSVKVTSGAVEAPSQTESNQARKIAWTIAAEVAMEHPMGVGTGDVSQVIDQKYLENGFGDLAEKSLNPHNNFLQIAVAQGLIAMLWFIWSLIYPLRRIVRKQQWIYGFFILSIFMNFMVESMLQKQSGVIYFAFLNAVFFFSRVSNKSLNKPKIKLEKQIES